MARLTKLQRDQITLIREVAGMIEGHAEACAAEYRQKEEAAVESRLRIMEADALRIYRLAAMLIGEPE